MDLRTNGLMDKIEIIKSIIENKNILNSKYELTVNPDQSGIGITIFNNTEHFVHKISIWIDKKNTYSSFIPLINFKEIEEIIGPILHKNKMKSAYDEVTRDTISLLSVNSKHFEDSNFKISKKIHSEQDVHQLLKDIKEYAERIAEPFFKKWSDLRVLNNFIDTIPQNRINKFISDGAFKKAVVYKLCNNSKYEEYINWLFDGLKNLYLENKNDDVSIENNYKIVLELKEILENMESIYNTEA